MDATPSQIKHLYEFGPFRLDPKKRLLWNGTNGIALGPKALEALLVLIENRDRVVSKDKLMKLLWPDSFVEESNLTQNIFLLRKALGESVQERRYILTVPGRGYQFVESVRKIETEEEESLIIEGHSRSTVLVERAVRRPIWPWAVLGIVSIVAIAAGRFWWISRLRVPSGRPAPLVVAEFTNATGDTVFDQTLRQVVASELGRSPAVEVMGDDRIFELLQGMGQPVDARLTDDLAKKVCLGGKGQILVSGAIRPQGGSYLLELTALDCAGGGIRAHEQAQAAQVNDVLPVVSRLAAATRLQLSGSDRTNALDPAPLDTSSVQAYKAYVRGYDLVLQQPMQALALLEKATQLDPDFADAWYFLGIAHMSAGESQVAYNDFKHAFDLRNHATGSERQRIEAMYYLKITGELHKAIDVLRAWESLEPNQFPPHNLLGFAYGDLGEHQKAADEFRQCIALGPQFQIGYKNLADELESQGQYQQAVEVLHRAQERKFGGWVLHSQLYELALLRSDASDLEQERAWMSQNEDDPLVVFIEAKIDMLAGKLNRGRSRMEHAQAMMRESNLEESATRFLLAQGAAEALFGESGQARATLHSAAKRAHSKDARLGVALVMMYNGQSRDARTMVEQLARQNPHDTLLNEVDVPSILAASYLETRQPEKALQALEKTRPYEFGNYAASYPSYLRGTAYLQLQKPLEGAREFQNVIDHRGLKPLSPVWEISYLAMARAYSLQGDTTRASSKYQEFLVLMKDADPDLPVVAQARKELATNESSVAANGRSR